jgi:hypothetical protein
MAYALTSDAFQVCISLTNIAGSRKMQASTNTTMNIAYFGSQNVSTVGSLTNKKLNNQSSTSSAGMIAGAVIGSILGCCLLIVVAFFIIFVTWTSKRSVKVKKQQSFELLNSPASTQSYQEPIDGQHDNVEQVQLTELVLQADNDKQVSVMEATNIQDAPVIEEIKAEAAVEEIVLDLSDSVTIFEPVLQSIEATISNTISAQESVPIQLDASTNIPKKA